uniref:DUS-like FMN-binding domain-containing protein n=1 Tax=Aegilops tauschii subsp. strangulata TaxID=200361 RepID=A0A453BRF4_AEGTS
HACTVAAAASDRPAKAVTSRRTTHQSPVPERDAREAAPPRAGAGTRMAIATRSAAWHALLPSLVPAKPRIFFLRSRPGRFLSHAHGLRPCGAASSLPPGEYLPPLFSVAPMMDWTDNHYRTLARLISRHAWLYTEMVVAETIVHQKDKLDRFLAFPAEQHPIVLQIGGSNLDNLAKATELASGYAYDEINLK